MASPVVIVIGGSSRIGKSTLAGRLADVTGADVLHLDALMEALLAVGVEFMAPETQSDLDDADAYIEKVRERSAVTNLAAFGYAEALIRRGADALVMEGGFWPDFTEQGRERLAEAGIRVVDVYLGSSSRDVADEARQIVEMGSKETGNWLSGRNVPEIERYCEVNNERFRRIAALAEGTAAGVFDLVGFGTDRGRMNDAAFERVIGELAV